MNKLAMMPIIKTIEGKNYWTNNDQNLNTVTDGNVCKLIRDDALRLIEVMYTDPAITLSSKLMSEPFD